MSDTAAEVKIGEAGQVRFDSEAIELLIPHRHPFLFVKSAVVVSSRVVEGIAQWEGDHPIFAGHFPDFPLVPGVLIAEAAAQIAGLLMSFNEDGLSRRQHAVDACSNPRPTINKAARKTRRIGMLTGLKRASFHKPVFADDRLTFNVELVQALGGMAIATAHAWFVPGQFVFKGELSVAVVDSEQMSALASSRMVPSDPAPSPLTSRLE